jgi:O-antigen/teichoic acid export membrane protein
MSRVKKTLLNAKINSFFYAATILLSFYSRKFFIGNLGNELVGLGATLANVLGFLNLAELGIGSAVSFLMYKPLHDNNENELQNIISVFGYYYRRIGFIIICFSCVLCLFLPFIFSSSTISLPVIYASFFTFLYSSLLGYFANYKQLLFSADQKSYVIVSYINSINILKIILQIFLLTHFKGNYYLFLAVELVFTTILSFVINIKIKNEYPWLKSSANSGEKLKQSYPQILKNTKQIFSHQFAGFILNQTDQLLVFSFTSLTVVTYLSNYILIIQKTTAFVFQLLSSNGAGVGNLIASNDKIRIKRVFGELMVLHYWFAGIIIFCLYILTPPFIKIWLGNEYLLEDGVFLLMLMNTYILITRRTNDSFLMGFGLFRDVWAPWAEAVLNLGISIILGFYYGVFGIMIGTFVSMVAIVVIWKPYFLFRDGFKENLSLYWQTVFKFIFLFLLTVSILYYAFLRQNPIDKDLNYLNLFIKACICGFGFALVYGILLYFFSASMRNLFERFWVKIIAHRKKVFR